MHIRNRVKELRKVPAKSLQPSPSNWRVHPEAQRNALQGVLAEIGYADALLARELEDGTLELIDGHLRAETTPDMEVPVLVLDVNEEEAKKLLATIDPLAAMAEADGIKLEALLREVTTDNAALAAMLADLRSDSAISAATITEDEVPAPLPVAVSRTGDLWVLPMLDGGEHRLLCGDSTSLEDVRRVMMGAKGEQELAALVATDPPYLVDYTGSRPMKGDKDSGKDWSHVYHEIDIKDADTFFSRLFANVLEVLGPKAPIYCWHAHRRCGLIQRIWEGIGILDHQQVIWVKPTPVFGRVYWHFRHEPCMMGWRKGSQPLHDNDHTFDSVWEIGWETAAAMAAAMEGAAHAGDVEADGDGGGRDDSGGGAGDEKARVSKNEHPTQKPVEIFARPMRKHTRARDIVFEPFSGSGSQLVAAEQLSRRCRAIEIEPVFVDVAIRRWQNLTGRDARLQETGETWTERAKAVGAVRAVGEDAKGATAKKPKPAKSSSKPRVKRRASRRGAPAGNQ